MSTRRKGWFVRFRRRNSSDFRSEIESHIAHEADCLIDSGMSAQAARSAALRTFGNVTAAQEQFYESSRILWLDHLCQDLRYGLRSIRQAPGFTLAAILTLALGIGANTAIFSLVDAVLIRSLPVERPRELMFLFNAGTEGPNGSPPYPCIERFRRETTSFAGVAAFAADDLKIQIDGAPENVFGQVVSDSYFEVLGVKAVLGRLIQASDEELDPRAAVIGYQYWQRRFGLDPNVIGKTLVFRNQVLTIIGVTLREFWGLTPGRRVDVTLPIALEGSLVKDPGAWWLTSFARLKPGVSVAGAQAETDAIFQTFMDERKNVPSDVRRKYFSRMELMPASQGLNNLRNRFSTSLLLLMCVVAAVLLIACANITNLLLARGSARSREFAIRLAIGAGKGRLVRQLLTETLMLFGLGAIFGLALAAVGLHSLTQLITVGRNPLSLDVTFDCKLLLFAAIITLASGLASGLLPATRAVRSQAQSEMNNAGTRLTDSGAASAAGRLLIVWQIALSTVVLAAAAAFLQTLANLRHVDLGFRPARVLTMSVESLIGDPASRAVFWNDVLARVRAIPGVRSATLSIMTPLSGRDRGVRIMIPGQEARFSDPGGIRLNHVSEGYFETFGIDLIAGRTFTERDAAGAPKVAIINESAAKLYFHGRDPVGRMIVFPKSLISDGVYRIVGISRDTKHMSIRQESPPLAYIPLRQPRDGFERVTLAVAADTPGERLAPVITRELRGVNAAALVSEIISAERQIDATLSSERLVTFLSTVLGLLALGLSAVGLYGVVSYGVNRRTAEIGIRMALGASSRVVACGVVRHVLIPVFLGMGLGSVAAIFVVSAAESLLYGLRPTDPFAYLTAAAVLLTIACATAYLPARRAAAIDPMQALRHQ